MKKNLKGKRFDKLLVLEETEKPKHIKSKRIYWLCKCDCGNTHIANTTELISGKIHQCHNCYLKENGMSRRKNYVGDKYGKLTVKEMLYNYNNTNKTYCRCSCECGNSNYITTIYDIKKNKYKSCGCDIDKKEIVRNTVGIDNTGQKFGRLLIKEILWEETPVKVRCLCDCGHVYIGIKTQVTSKQTLSCGCLKKERIGLANEIDSSGYISEYGIEILEKTRRNIHNQWLYKCKCGFCNNEFEELPARIKNNHIKSCGCILKSSGEKIVSKILEDLNIEYKTQYSFDDCVSINNYKLRFDFAILNKLNNIELLIEYDGLQHFKPIKYFGGNEGYLNTVNRDNIKNTYCEEHKIKLLRLPYNLTVNEIKEQIINTIYP